MIEEARIIREAHPEALYIHLYFPQKQDVIQTRGIPQLPTREGCVDFVPEDDESTPPCQRPSTERQDLYVSSISEPEEYSNSVVEFQFTGLSYQ